MKVLEKEQHLYIQAAKKKTKNKATPTKTTIQVSYIKKQANL